jgi:hypothetical protein
LGEPKENMVGYTIAKPAAVSHAERAMAASMSVIGAPPRAILRLFR